MAELYRAYWKPDPGSGLIARDRRGGHYERYVPDLVTDRPLIMPPDLAARAASAERDIRRLGTGPGSGGLQSIARFLLRSEAIASSMIEGIAPSPQQVALAELAQDEDIRGFSDQARLVANNISVLRRASSSLVDTDAVTVDDVVMLHAALLPDERHHGLRHVQNWIGGSNWHPLEADFVPPSPEDVGPLMTDLVDYLNGSLHGPLIQAGIVHAQFETIHPFTDGNGRVGRALIHTVLARRGLAPEAVLPISLVLSTLSARYVDGLSAYRYVGSSVEPGALAGVNDWLSTFIEAAVVASEHAQRLAQDIDELEFEWAGRLAGHREAQGLRGGPRAGSATARILPVLAEAPIMTARTVQRILGVSFPAARAALEELADAGVLSRKSVERGTTGYVARDVLDLIDCFRETCLGIKDVAARCHRAGWRRMHLSGAAVPDGIGAG
ncbi:Fic family protein [Rhodococcus artemisiae]|uniref:Fic family protein n=1 Tax=Rhodococcus artemisiae TaxID=714159 RepID=A0ABU7L8Z2_9NOCA|nr:Fic family protein [Rhodococcus artemisiae]MEE2058011.1 Fic family protein [Rhodococcus artemisiae]